MKGVFLFVLIFVSIVNHQIRGQHLISDYDLSLELNLSNSNWTRNSIKGKATMHFADSSNIHNISFLLNRLLDVDSVLVQDKIVSFKQDLTKVENWESYQVSHTYVNNLNNPEKITIYYHGKIASYTETGMLYVKEKLDQDFFIIRPESMSFPQVASPTNESILERWRKGSLTDFSISIKVNSGYACVSGSKFVETEKQTYKSSMNQVRQLTIPIAKYDTINTEDYNIFHFRQDSIGAKRISSKISQALKIYNEWFGPKLSNNKFVVAEIPEDYGSQAIFPLIIQTADAFNDSKSDVLIFHELSHFWNIDDLNATYSNRLNEGLAMFLQYLVKSKMDSAIDIDSIFEQKFISFKDKIISRKRNQLPMNQFGIKGKTHLSYSTGLLFFALLYKCNPVQFIDKYRTFYQNNKTVKVSDDEFLRSFIYNNMTEKIIYDWFETNRYLEKVHTASNFNDLLLNYKKLD